MRHIFSILLKFSSVVRRLMMDRVGRNVMAACNNTVSVMVDDRCDVV